MDKLSQMDCVSVEKGAVPLSDQDINQYHQQVPDWQLVTIDGVPRLTREFKFKDFASALHFTDVVGRIAEQQDHHPVLVTEWGKVTVTWWTHKVNGLHLNDFIMAEKTDLAYESEPK